MINIFVQCGQTIKGTFVVTAPQYKTKVELF